MTQHEFHADLHCHTTCSDGSLTPEQIIDLAIQENLQGLSITDHDSVDAYVAAMPYALKKGLPLIPGVEFSTTHKGSSVHVLAYAFSERSPIIQQFCTEHQKRREERIKEMLFLLEKSGMPISEEELYANRDSRRGIGRPHLAQAMLKKGYVKDIAEAFKRFIGEDKPCYTSGRLKTIEETLDVIRQSNAFAVLAHPHLIDNTAVLKSLLDMPFDGMECYYARFNIGQNKRWLKIAEHRKWLITGGSDFHGMLKPAIPLGCSWTREDIFHLFQKRYIDNSKNLLGLAS